MGLLRRYQPAQHDAVQDGAETLGAIDPACLSSDSCATCHVPVAFQGIELNSETNLNTLRTMLLESFYVSDQVDSDNEEQVWTLGRRAAHANTALTLVLPFLGTRYRWHTRSTKPTC